MVDVEDLREQFINAFKGANYPVSSAMELIPALPDGLATEFEAEDFSMTVVELNAELGEGNYPYGDVESLVDDIIEGLKDEGLI